MYNRCTFTYLDFIICIHVRLYALNGDIEYFTRDVLYIYIYTLYYIYAHICALIEWL